MRGLFALAEDYPDLRASERFANLQTQLVEIEDALQAARRYYNAVVRDLNTLVASFPTLLVAGRFGFVRRDFFELESPLERQAPEAKFDERIR
jgi:LemA protein